MSNDIDFSSNLLQFFILLSDLGKTGYAFSQPSRNHENAEYFHGSEVAENQTA